MRALLPQKSSKLKSERGFTLLELMVASTGALFITVAVYAFTRNVTDYFQKQMRLSDATMNAVTGFERLRTDIQRAGFLASPNLARDPLRCPRPTSGAAVVAPQQNGVLPAGIQQMGLAQIESGFTLGAYGTNYMLTNNAASAGGINPDRLMLYGNYSSTDQFSVKAAPAGSNYIVLESGSASMRRLGIPTGNTATDTALLSAVFQTGGIVRVADTAGRHQYALVASLDFTTDSVGDATLWLNPVVQLIRKENAAGATCGIVGPGADLVVNPVDIIRYQLVDLNDATAYPDFVPLFAADLARPAYDATRLDLIRERLDPTDWSVIPGSTELVTEYAVDLKFGLTVNTNTATGANTYFGEDDVNLPNYAGDPIGADAGQMGAYGPHLIRGIHARLSVRTREADFKAPLLTGAALASATSADLYRVAVAPGEYARLRSLRAHIATRNTRSETWQ
jgi:Tfp pilus assembly protein PilW